jgi:hypothetical protein
MDFGMLLKWPFTDGVHPIRAPGALWAFSKQRGVQHIVMQHRRWCAGADPMSRPGGLSSQ